MLWRIKSFIEFYTKLTITVISLTHSFSFSLILLTTQSHLHFSFCFLIWKILKRTVENQEFYMKVLDLEKTGTQKRNPKYRFSYNGAQILAGGQGKAMNI